jgi:hypothetical protein
MGAEVAGNERVDGGGGVIADRDGDQTFEVWEGKRVEGGETGTTELVGDIGKFAGISGTGEWAIVDYFIDPDDKRARAVISLTFNWKRP